MWSGIYDYLVLFDVVHIALDLNHDDAGATHNRSQNL